MSESHQDLVYHQSLANAGAEMANLEINILSITNDSIKVTNPLITNQMVVKFTVIISINASIIIIPNHI